MSIVGVFWSVFFSILTECGKIRTGKTPNIGTFHAVILMLEMSQNTGKHWDKGEYVKGNGKNIGALTKIPKWQNVCVTW